MFLKKETCHQVAMKSVLMLHTMFIIYKCIKHDSILNHFHIHFKSFLNWFCLILSKLNSTFLEHFQLQTVNQLSMQIDLHDNKSINSATSFEILFKVSIVLCTSPSFKSSSNPFQSAAKTHLLHHLFIFSPSS